LVDHVQQIEAGVVDEGLVVYHAAIIQVIEELEGAPAAQLATLLLVFELESLLAIEHLHFEL